MRKSRVMKSRVRRKCLTGEFRDRVSGLIVQVEAEESKAHLMC
jgi:hypothetical protein